jgi:hypothetical protein
MTLNVRLGASLVFVLVSLILTASTASAQCKSPDLPYVPMSAVIAQGGWLSSDGRGAYVDGTQGSTVNLVNAANLLTGQSGALNSRSRFLAFILDGPVVGDPLAQPQGVIQDRQGEVHVFYKLDPVGTDGLRQKHSLEELPDDGVFYASERADLFVHINGARHLLMFGGDTWPINTCQLSVGLVFDAPGTTKLQIARVPGSDTYILQAPPGSIARLFDYRNTFAPVDKGLYRFSFLVTLSPKPKKGK